MSKSENYENIAQDVAVAIGQIVGRTQRFSCSRHSMNHSTELLVQDLRRVYGLLIKPLFKQHPRECDPEMQRELGAIFGALITHMQAINAWYWVYRKSDTDNKWIDQSWVEDQCSKKAALYGVRSAQTIAQQLSQLAAVHVEKRVRAEMLAEFIRIHLVDNLGWMRYQQRRIAKIYATGFSSACVDFVFTWQDAVANEYGPLGIGQLFDGEEARQEIRGLVELAFGTSAKFSEDFNRVEWLEEAD
jgi:hypothetical protein